MADDDVYLFVHVMKTGGTSFIHYLHEVVGATKTVTILREPVERTISMLKHWLREWAPDKSLEENYEDPMVFKFFIDNHQTKVFALDPSDDPNAYLVPTRIDRARLDAAKERLASIDVVGVQERYDRFLTAVQDEFGWPAPSRRFTVNVGHPVVLPDGLRERIAEDMAWDRELYDFALELAP